MNSPVTHAECEKYRECIANDFRAGMAADRADFNAAYGRVEAWILRLEAQITKTNDAIVETNKTMALISKEVAIGLFFAVVYIFGGKQ